MLNTLLIDISHRISSKSVYITSNFPPSCYSNVYRSPINMFLAILSIILLSIKNKSIIADRAIVSSRADPPIQRFECKQFSLASLSPGLIGNGRRGRPNGTPAVVDCRYITTEKQTREKEKINQQQN